MDKETTVFDLSDPIQARMYLEGVRFDGRPIEVVYLSSGRELKVKDMTDEEIMTYASQIWEFQMLGEHRGPAM